MPGGGLLRDGQKWTIFWVLLLSVCAPRGLQLLSRRAERPLALFLAASLALAPLAVLPDLAWGGLGRLKTADYPDVWDQVRTRLAEDPRPGDVASLPWAAFRRYDWNHQDVVLDPLPRFLTRTVVWNDSLPVSLDGELAEVGGDDPRAAAISAAIRDGAALGPVLGDLGVRWVIVQSDQPVPGRQPDLTGTRQVWESGSLALLEVESPLTALRSRDAVVVAVDVAVAILIGVLAVITARRRDPDGPKAPASPTDVT